MSRNLIKQTAHVNIGTIGHVDRQNDFDGGDNLVLGKHNPKITVRAFDSIDNAHRKEPVLRLPRRTSNNKKRRTGITRTWTVQDTPITWKI